MEHRAINHYRRLTPREKRCPRKAVCIAWQEEKLISVGKLATVRFFRPLCSRMHKSLDYSANLCEIVNMERLQHGLIKEDLTKKMVFLTGPRQVGKTYLALAVAREFEKAVYLNYDNLADRAIIEQTAWLPDTALLVLDELHKMEQWKNYVKGVYDTKPPHLQVLITGSARLETFRQSGDSLAGRFFRHRLNPLSVVETGDGADLDRLMERGGFPEPYLADTRQDAERWRLQYIDGLIRIDILDFERVHDFKAMQLTLDLLRQRVGSQLSYTSLARDVNCAPNTIKRYVEILEALFIVFRIYPYHRNIARSLLKEPKLYFYDTGMVHGDAGIRFENTVAVCLQKHLNAVEDYEGRRTELMYLRTKEKKEVDFVLVTEDAPPTMVEAKLSDISVSPALHYFHKKYDLPAIQIVKNLRQERMEGAIQLRRAADFLKTLKM
jgi:predicted AAA+ superfamily ATPase